MADIRESKYAHFLEDVCSDIVKTEPKNIAVVFFSGDGEEAHTHYFGNCYPAEVGQMAWQLNADAMLTMAQTNARLILEAAILEAAEEEEDGEPEEN